MAKDTLKGLNVAILVTDGFEQVELTEPRKALDEAGATTKIVSPKPDRVRAWNFTDWSVELPVDLALDQAKPEDFDVLLLPGGVINPDKLRMLPNAVAFAKSFFDAGKPVAAICHGPWTVIETGAARGRRMASWPSLKTDLKMPARTAWTRKRSWTRAWSRAAIPMTSRPSTGRRSNYLAAHVGGVMLRNRTSSARTSVQRRDSARPAAQG
jgi:protease I